MLTQDLVTLSSKYGKKEATVYQNTADSPRAVLFYFHGGGLLYGIKDDLPDEHIRLLTDAGLMIIACDYPLAPAVGIEEILADAESSVCELHSRFCVDEHHPLPCFLWGRSAGAYLCLLMAVRRNIPPCCGVISYYGYGLLTDGWFDQPNSFYNSLPAVDSSCAQHIPDQVHMSGALDTCYSLYVYARQTGKWFQMISKCPAKQFYRDYTLRLSQDFPVPLFCAHSLHDPDVPFAEFQALASKYPIQKYIAVSKQHDFDRSASQSTLHDLLSSTLNFIDHHI